ncbi:hypothetical protein R3P38DRAFT_3312220 [Favolaschia claudopus]|uniref:DUF6589 domain-containing protein n=1 Tax=Favolaschia claudopus TaxID=2862362 RepID=A0AAW0C873_9AGAR
MTQGQWTPLTNALNPWHRRKAPPPPVLESTAAPNSLFPSSYDTFFTNFRKTASLPLSQISRPLPSFPELLSQTKEKFQSPEFVFDPSASITPLRKTQSQSDLARTTLRQLASRRSQKCTDFAGPMTLYWWKSGCSEEVLEVLQNVGLSKCFDSCLDMVTTVADYCLDDARNEAQDPASFMGNWDNINMLNSESYEQRSDGPAKVRSGSCGVIYRLCSPNPNAMALEPLLKRAKSAPDLEFHRDICPTLSQKSKRGHVTKQFPVRISTIEENSIAGNLAVHEDIFVTQLGLTHAELSKKAILAINDQATQSFNRGCKAIRALDLSPFLRAQVFQLGIGLFHLCLNLVWALLHAHRGHETIEGSLSYSFVLLEKTRLGGKHPDYHTLMAALMQILDGLLLDAWRIECGRATLSEFAQTKPSPEQLLVIADNILCNHATPERNPSSSPVDNLRENTRRLVHDVAEVTRAISDCDFGRVEDLLGNLAMIFRGAGSKNYCTEILHFIHNLKYVWKGDGFDNLVRDNMIFNMGSGKGQGVDMNLEHNIGKIKQLFAAKGNYADWSRLANISAAIDVLSSMKINIGRSLGACYKGTSHKDVDTSSLVWRVARKAKDLELSTTQPNRSVTATPDLLLVGEAAIKSSTLAKFNKKRRELLKGIIDSETGEDEEDRDELPEMDIGVSLDD